jgi:YD repeat-containing protein
MTVSGQSPVTYGYDADSRLIQVVQGTQVVTLAYDSLARRTQLTFPNGVSTDYQYDSASRLTALIYRNALGVLGDLNYQYDKSGNRIAVGGSFARTLLPGPISSATYDAANRQLEFGNDTMAYDRTGNLSTIMGPSGVTTFSWDARNRLAGTTGQMATVVLLMMSLEEEERGLSAAN